MGEGEGMNEPVSETTWRNRFILINLVQIGSAAVALLGIAAWQSDLLVEGGTALGFPVALVGLFASFFAPRLLARRWKTPPQP